MSLDYLDAQIDDYRTQASNIVEHYSQTQAEVSADPNLTDVGKLEALAPLHEDVTAKVGALRAKEKAAIKHKRETLEKDLFGMNGGSSSDVVSYRDAQDRAARLTDPDEAQEVYTRALRSDDKILAQAILSRALDYNWHAITTDYRQRNPSASTALNDLTRLGQYENNGFMALMHYVVPPLTTAQPMRIR
ncbi:hypothetical protein [Williamsia herbipolensis]|uniref:hypothetical protein n=1 Tax=Williamsia herbipolensis TaxID=1603258 RepID=UPI00069906A0|nr:hypothetical protein [Williamsia herbipolensis]